MDFHVTQTRYKTLGGNKLVEYRFFINKEERFRISAEESEAEDFNILNFHDETFSQDWHFFIKNAYSASANEDKKTIMDFLVENEAEIDDYIARKQIDYLEKKINDLKGYLMQPV